MTTDIVLRREFAAIVIPATQALLDKVKFDLADASDLDVCSASMAEEAQEIIGRLATVHDAMDEERKKTAEPLRDGQAWVNNGYRPAIETLAQTILQLKDKLKGWNKVVAARKAEAEAKERADRKKAADATAAAEDTARGKARDLIAKAQEQADPVQRHLLLAEAGDVVSAAVEAAGNAASAAVAPITTGITSGVKGASTKWKGRLVDADPEAMQKFLLCVVNRPELRECVRIDESGLNIFASLTKGKVHIPGIVFYEEDTIRTAKRPV